MGQTWQGIRVGNAVHDAQAERIRAHVKHVGTPAGSREQRPHDDPLWLPIIMEEVGEMARALNDGEPLGRVRAEAIQVAAMALAYADALEEAMHEEVRRNPGPGLRSDVPC